jgi:hypothetical protein
VNFANDGTDHTPFPVWILLGKIEGHGEDVNVPKASREASTPFL